MKILFVTSNRLGDAVLSTGLLDLLIRAHPEASITIVCGPVAEGLFTRMPNHARTIVLTKRRFGGHWMLLWLATATTFWDLVVDIRGSALSWLVPTRRRAVFRRSAGPKICQLAAILGLAAEVGSARGLVAEPVRDAKLTTGMAPRLVSTPLPVAWIGDVDRNSVSAKLQAGRPIIALAPTANWAPKVWPAERFAAVFDLLSRSLVPHALAVVLGGPGPAEATMAAPLLAALPNAIDLVGKLSLPEVAAWLERSALFIGNDSGLMHLAAAAGAPTIGLFGPTDAAVYAPAGRLAVAVAGADGSMAAISVGQVTAAAEALLRQSSIAASSAASVASMWQP